MRTTFKIGVVFGMVFSVILIFNMLALARNNSSNDLVIEEQPKSSSYPLFKIGESIEISKVSPSKLTVGENLEVFYIENQTKRRVVYQNNLISQLNFSPTGDKFGYLVNYDIYDTKIAYDRTTLLYIEDTQTRKPKEFFHGSFRTSGWKWFSDDEVLVSYGCGTECQVQLLINLRSGKEYELQYGVRYSWSPDKNWVFAYNYSNRTGITVGDKFGNIKFRFNINPPENEMANTPLALWSPDSNKLALISKIDGREEFELLIFNASQKFRKIFRSDVDYMKIFDLKWNADSKSVTINSNMITF